MCVIFSKANRYFATRTTILQYFVIWTIFKSAGFIGSPKILWIISTQSKASLVKSISLLSMQGPISLVNKNCQSQVSSSTSSNSDRINSITPSFILVFLYGATSGWWDFVILSIIASVTYRNLTYGCLMKVSISIKEFWAIELFWWHIKFINILINVHESCRILLLGTFLNVLQFWLFSRRHSGNTKILIFDDTTTLFALHLRV